MRESKTARLNRILEVLRKHKGEGVAAVDVACRIGCRQDNVRGYIRELRDRGYKINVYRETQPPVYQLEE